MPETIMLRFKACPGLYPPHKGGQTWLHERSGPKRVPHDGAPDKFTMKVMPKIVIQSGETFMVDADMAKTLMARHPECFSLIDSPAPVKAAAKKVAAKILPEDDA